MTESHPAARALVYTAPRTAAIEPVDLPCAEAGQITVRARYGLLSRGTERLVFEGRVPPSEYARMRAPMQQGAFPFPVRYGYALVGRVESGPDRLIGRDVFALHPHQTLARLPASAVVAVPDTVPAGRAVLAANMETALNAIWDAPVPPGARCLVVGGGLLGWFITALLSLRNDIHVTLTDIRAESGIKADDFTVSFTPPERVPAQAFDVAFHTSASAAGLATALGALAFEGTVIELSWFGDSQVSVPLGGAFHANRLRIVSSQVGHVAPVRRASTTRHARLTAAMAALGDPRLDALPMTEAAFDDLPRTLGALLAPGAPGIGTRIVYPGA